MDGWLDDESFYRDTEHFGLIRYYILMFAPMVILVEISVYFRAGAAFALNDTHACTHTSHTVFID